MIDLRSDTVTLPTPAMRVAMAQAQVGDDVYGEDLTVNRLEEIGATRMGKEAGLFVASGTMGNLTAVLAHCQRGDEVIMGHLGHTFLFEGGGISALGGVFAHILSNESDGTIKIGAISDAIRPNDIHQPPSRLLILENTHNRCGGVAITKEFTQVAADLVHQHGMQLHLDGARIFNAAVSQGIPAKELAAPADSVTFCLSKGLCAPVGSILCGSGNFIEHARRIRKMLGGGMRQAGILASAGLVALDTMVDRLEDDHLRARRLAEGLAIIPGIKLEMGLPATNMVFISLENPQKTTGKEIQQKLIAQDIKIGLIGDHTFRLVTHYWISDQDIESVIQAFQKVLK
jgi:threonine aldolase